MSIVSVSRRAGPPHFGHVTFTNSGTCASGESPRPVNSRDLRQLHRQLLVGHRHDAVRLAVDHRDRRAPVALARDAPVLQPELHGPFADAALLRRRRSSASARPPTAGPLYSPESTSTAVRVGRLGQRRRVPPASPSGVMTTLNRQVVLARELEVALVVRRHRHHRARAVVAEHEVRHPDRHRLVGERVDRAEAGVEALLLDLAADRARRGPGCGTSAPACGTRAGSRDRSANCLDERVLGRRAARTSRRRSCRCAW